MQDKTIKEPTCKARACSYSRLSMPEAGTWIDFYIALRTPTIKESGLATEVLRMADALTGDVLEVFIALDGVVAEWQQQQRENR